MGGLSEMGPEWKPVVFYKLSLGEGRCDPNEPRAGQKKKWTD